MIRRVSTLTFAVAIMAMISSAASLSTISDEPTSNTGAVAVPSELILPDCKEYQIRFYDELERLADLIAFSRVVSSYRFTKQEEKIYISITLKGWNSSDTSPFPTILRGPSSTLFSRASDQFNTMFKETVRVMLSGSYMKDIYGIKITMVWDAGKPSERKAHLETLTIFCKKEDVLAFLNEAITQETILERSIVLLNNKAILFDPKHNHASYIKRGA